MFFSFLISAVIVQRLIELFIARKNRKWAKQQGGIEFGAGHYKYLVLMHVAFFVSLFIEYSFHPSLHRQWMIFLLLFLIVQFVRLWSLISLGREWNTRIIVIPHATRVAKGPYRFLKHPNYLVVSAEIFLLPVIFEAYVTAIVFTIINVILLVFVRIPIEETALQLLSEDKSRFS